MNNMKKITATEIITKGYLWVNIPVIAIILIVWISLQIIFNLNNLICISVGTLAGWYYWGFSIKKWVKWAIKNEVEKERLLKIGQSTLLLSKQSIIDNAISNEKK